VLVKLRKESMTEILTDTALRQLTQMFLAIIFFYASEYILARAIHGPSMSSVDTKKEKSRQESLSKAKAKSL
ncbi:hypothetical protein IGI04_030092, partial [Brassica rapa subsp. trilocularis]